MKRWALWRTWKLTSFISIFQMQEEKIIKNQFPQLSFEERICYLLILGKIISSRSSRPGIQSSPSTICSLPWLILDLRVPGLMSIQGLLPGKIFPSKAVLKTHFFPSFSSWTANCVDITPHSSISQQQNKTYSNISYLLLNLCLAFLLLTMKVTRSGTSLYQF